MKLHPTSFWVLPIIASLVAFGPLSTDMYLPAQPSIKEDLQASIEQIQLTLSIFLIGTSLALPFWGPLADRFGRRNIMLVGISLFIVSSIACALATTIESLIFFRFIQSIGACVGPTIGRTMVRDIYGADKAAKAFAYLASIMALAPAIAPVLGGFIVMRYEWPVIFYVLAGLAVICTVIYVATIGETLEEKYRQSINPLSIWKNYKILGKDASFIAYTLITSAVFAGLFSFISAASFIFIEFLELTAQEFGFCFLGMVIGFITGSSSGAYASGKLAANNIILTGLSFCGIAAATCLALSVLAVFHPLAVVIPIAFYALGVGLIMPQCTAASFRNYPHIAGTASSFAGIIQNTLAATAGIGVAAIHQDTPTTMAIFLLIGSLLALGFYFLLLPESEK